MTVKDRIQIDGVWYVKEKENSKVELQDLLYTQQCLLELDKCSFEAVRIFSDYNNEIFIKNSLYIKYVNKQTQNEECWDNNTWMNQLLKGNKEALNEVSDTLSNDEIQQLKLFISKLIEDECLNN